jgi:hypothetical protein
VAIPFAATVDVDGGSTGSVTLSLPPGAQADDILFLTIEGEGEDTNADAAPTGGEWTPIDDEVGGDGSVASGTTGQADKTRLTIYWHRYNGSDEPNWVVPDAGDHTLAGVYAIRGCETSGTPIHVTQSSSDSTNDTSVNITGVTTTVGNCLVTHVTAAGDNRTVAGYTTGNLANFNDHGSNATTAGSNGAMDYSDGELASAGASGTITATSSMSEEEANWAIAFMEPQGAGGRTTLNTRSNPLGQEIAMGWRMVRPIGN